MPITVVCPGCLKRFTVADKHGGKQGPCPSCDTLIDIPKASDEVVIHAPDDGGPKDAKGRAVLKTQKAKDAKFSPVLAGAAGVGVLVAFGVAFAVKGTAAAAGLPLLGGAAVLLGPLLAWAGYGFLRDGELEPYSGSALAIRSLACGLGFAAGWGAYALLAYQLGGEWPIPTLEMYQLALPLVAAVGIGALASHVSLDLDPAVGAFHFVLYFAVTVALRVTMALPALPGLG